jgi:hypothetical protein
MIARYTASYFPPAPQIEMRLAIPDESFSVGPLIGFMDTGADATIVPLRYPLPKRIQAAGMKYLRSQWGERRTVAIYWLDVGIGDYRFPNVEIVADNQGDEVIVGRNVLNLLRVLMDGPKQTIAISE